MYPKKGIIAQGSDADLVLLDPELEKTLSVKDSLIDTGWNTFDGVRVKGLPSLTMLRGEVIAENGKFTGRKGNGRFFKRQMDPDVLRYPIV